MGIEGLASLLMDVSPDGVNHHKRRHHYSGKTIAIDASIYLYQNLASSNKMLNGHLIGPFQNNILLLEHGIRPVYVFDGKPPKLKMEVIKQRAQRRVRNMEALNAAKERGDQEAVIKLEKQVVKLDKTHVEELKMLLDLTGIPYLEAPGEAEAQCAALVRAGKVFATATEDMDALTFGSTILLRNIFGPLKKRSIQEFNLEKILVDLKINQNQFIDLSILLGCDYCDVIKMIGPKRAIEMIQKYKNIETIIKNLNPLQFKIPEDWRFEEARNIFVNPEVINYENIEFALGRLNKDGITDFMCGLHNFSHFMIRKGVVKLSRLLPNV